jgi:hypothetical protein
VTSSDWQAVASVVQAVSSLAVVLLTCVLAWVNVRTLRQVKEQTAATRAQWQLSEIPLVAPIDVKHSKDRWEVTFKNLADRPVLDVRLRGANEAQPQNTTTTLGSTLWPGQTSVLTRNEAAVQSSFQGVGLSVETSYRSIRGLDVKARWLCAPIIQGLTASPGFFLESLDPQSA